MFYKKVKYIILLIASRPAMRKYMDIEFCIAYMYNKPV